MITTIVKTISKSIELKEVVREASDTYTFKFSVPQGTTWKPGAYAHFVCSNLEKGEKIDKKESIRELSIMSHPKEGYVGFTTRIRTNPSLFKQALLNLQVGDNIRMFKIGNHFEKRSVTKPIVFISMGVGIATFRPLMLDYLENQPEALPIMNINIDRTADFVYENEFHILPKDKVKNMFVTNRSALLERIDSMLDSDEKEFYIVGSKEFNSTIGDYLTDHNIAKRDIIFDKH